MFDYEVPHRCEFGVPAQTIEQVTDCSQPAPYYIWWLDYDTDGLWVCEKHFQLILEHEQDE